MFYLLPSVCLVPHFLSVRFRRRPLKNLSGTRRSDVFLQAVLGLLPRFIFAYILFMLLDWFRALFRTTVKRPAEIEVENNMLFFVFSCLTVWKLFWHVIMTRHVHTYRAKVVKTSWQNRSQKVTNGRQFYLLSLGSTGVETENDEEQFKADIKTRYFFFFNRSPRPWRTSVLSTVKAFVTLSVRHLPRGYVQKYYQAFFWEVAISSVFERPNKPMVPHLNSKRQ